MSQLNPYLNFSGDTREAMEFYQEVFGGDLNVVTFADFNNTAQDGVMHATLVTPGGLVLMASDLPPGMELKRGNDVHLSLSGPDADELRGWWDGLSQGAQVAMPLAEQAWGDEFGMLIDRFGVSWMVNITPSDQSE